MKFGKLSLIGAVGTLLLATTLLVGCKGATGPAGPAGNNPAMAPRITALLAVPDSISAGQTSRLIVSAYDPNGDSVTYVWTASAGSFNDVTAASPIWTAPDTAVLAYVHVRVTARGDSTTSGLVIGVDTHVPTIFPNYIGDDQNTCGHCHAATVDQWKGTHHFGGNSYDSLGTDTTNMYCLQCHTTGFDDQYSYGGQLAHHGVNNGGYDDFARPALKGIQCEQCHGAMGPNGHQPDIEAGLNSSACAKCHAGYQDWAASKHGMALQNAGGQSAFFTEWGGSCNPCHIQEGFIKAQDPDWASFTLSASNVHAIGCATCHDPHKSTNAAQLRTVASVSLMFNAPDSLGYTVSGWGSGQLCAQCHHARRNASSIIGQLNSGSSHPGPHDSPQADMVAGHGCWEPNGGTAISRSSQHHGLTNMCNDCHFAPRANGDPIHSFEPQLSQCITCHPGAASFDIAGVQTEIRGMVEELAGLLPHDSTGHVAAAFDTLNWTRAQREGGYVYMFVEADKSMGVHNYDYARTLLRNAIDYIQAHPAENPAAKAEKSFWK